MDIKLITDTDIDKILEEKPEHVEPFRVKLEMNNEVYPADMEIDKITDEEGKTKYKSTIYFDNYLRLNMIRELIKNNKQVIVDGKKYYITVPVLKIVDKKIKSTFSLIEY